MLSILDKILLSFSNCFSRIKPFFFFILTIIAFMLVTDDSGVTSFIRVLFLEPKTYEGLIHFFNSDAYDLSDILKKWVHLIESSPQAVTVEGRGVLVGDHTKLSKEGRCMPGMKSHHQESEDFGKPGTIFGFHFGMLGLLVGSKEQKFCTPVQIKIHEGTEQLAVWKGQKPKGRALRLIEEALTLVKTCIRSYYLLLDRDFMSKEGIKAVLEHNAGSQNRLDLIGRCKKSVTCRRNLTEEEIALNKKQKRRGRPRKYSSPVKPVLWFKDHKDDFRKVTLSDGAEVEIFSRTEYWDNKLLLFVLSIQNGRRAILFTTDLSLAPERVVELYRLRFNIETSFNGLKHVVHGFSFHFWVKGFEKLTKFSKDRLCRVPEEQKPRVLKCIRRIERSVNFAGMAYGILQLMVLEADLEISPREIRYQRTYRHEDQLSVEQLQVLFSSIFSFLVLKNPENRIIKIIQRFMSDDFDFKIAA